MPFAIQVRPDNIMYPFAVRDGIVPHTIELRGIRADGCALSSGRDGNDSANLQSGEYCDGFWINSNRLNIKDGIGWFSYDKALNTLEFSDYTYELGYVDCDPNVVIDIMRNKVHIE